MGTPTSSPRIGITLQPEVRYLELLQPVFDDADYFEIAPETMWARDKSGEWCSNDFFDVFLEEGRKRRKPFVAHAVYGSIGTVDPGDGERQKAWLHRMAKDHEAFRFEWLTDHLGASVLGEHSLALPIALPMNEAMAGVVRDRLLQWQQLVPDVGFENSAFYFLLGEWRDEPAFFRQILTAPRTHLLLDLHNVHTIASNLGEDAAGYLQRLDLTRVIEIHLSGGVDSPPDWLPNKRSLRLDSHDDDVPEAVWQLFEQVLPRCVNLRGVTLERMEGTVDAADVPTIHRELHRIREAVQRVH